MSLPKKLLLTCIAIVGLAVMVACSRQGSGAEGSAADSLENILSESETALSRYNYKPDEDTEWKDSLDKYFTPKQIVYLRKAKTRFFRMNTAGEVGAFYLYTLDSVADIFNTQIAAMTDPYGYPEDLDARWKWFTEYFPGIYSEKTCGECEYAAMITMATLLERAQATPEVEDDHFLKLSNSVYGSMYYAGGSVRNSDGWNQLVGCDFCNTSLLGNGKRINILNDLEEAAPARTLFGKKMDEYLEFILDFRGNDYFYYPKPTVLSELDQMLKSPMLSSEQKKSVAAYRTNVERGVNVKGFNCGEEDCFPNGYGGMEEDSGFEDGAEGAEDGTDFFDQGAIDSTAQN